MNTLVMNTPTVSDDQNARDHLKQRVHDAYHTHRRAIHKHFLDVNETPNTIGELKEWLAKGKLRLIKHNYKDERKLWGYSWSEYLTFNERDADEEGYNEAMKNVDKAHRETVDLIIVSTPKEGLEALKAFEAKTFH